MQDYRALCNTCSFPQTKKGTLHLLLQLLSYANVNKVQLVLEAVGYAHIELSV